MSQTVYNISLAAGVALIGAGVGMVSVPAALTVVGAVVIGLAMFGATLSRKG